MKCAYCGAEISDTATLCPKCGAILDEEALREADEARQASANAVVTSTAVTAEKNKSGSGKGNKPKKPKKKANGCAIAGFIFAFLPVLNVIGLILSAVGIAKAKKLGGSGKGLAIAGLVISILMIVIVLIGAVILAVIYGSALVAQGCAQGLSGACSEMGESCGDGLRSGLN